jgi:DNA-binding response OmpR family regulator
VKVSRIVIVEDNPADVLLVKEALIEHRVAFTFQHFMNGEDAAKAISEMLDPPQLFLLDLNVPRVHGLELLRLIRACPLIAEVPVGILTSSNAPADRTQSKKLGADAYILKPQGYNEFVADVGGAIVQLLERKSPRGCGGAVGIDPYKRGNNCITSHWRCSFKGRGQPHRQPKKIKQDLEQEHFSRVGVPAESKTR